MRVDVAPDTEFVDFDGESVLLNRKTGYFYGLDEIGTRVWVLLQEHGGDIHSTIHTMLQEYDVDETTLARDIEILVSELVKAGLLRVVQLGTVGCGANQSPAA